MTMNIAFDIIYVKKEISDSLIKFSYKRLQ